MVCKGGKRMTSREKGLLGRRDGGDEDGEVREDGGDSGESTV